MLVWLLVIAVAAFINLFLVTTVGISGSSMEPGLRDGERVFVPRYEIWWQRLTGSGFERGDIVFFPDPTAADCRVFCPLVIKRIVGLPGETVGIRAGAVSVDGAPLAEPYLGDAWAGSFSMEPRLVPEGNYFVLGDNRYPYGSQDSRNYGPVPAGSIAGRASAVLWPPLRNGPAGVSLNWRAL